MDKIPELFTQNPRLREILEQARRYAPTGYPILISGETGTGKELLARYLHLHSDREAHPFLVESPGAFRDTLLESELFGVCRGAFSGADEDRAGLLKEATGGTLYLDGIEDAARECPGKLLRFLQDGTVRPVGGIRSCRVDLRLISSTGRSMTELRDLLREDFFHRIGVLQLRLPPLRERLEDLPLLAREMAREAGYRGQLPDDFVEALSRYPWPGNLRELKNAISSLALCRGDALSVDHLYDYFASMGKEEARTAGPGPFWPALAREEKRLIQEALVRHRFNKIRAARELQVSRTWMYDKVREHGLKAG